MKNKKPIILLMVIVFLLGLGVALYPTLSGRITDSRIQQDAKEFLEQKQIQTQSDTTQPATADGPTEPDEYVELWRDIVAYNKAIFTDGQEGLDCELAYEEPSFILANYGLENEIFAVVSIPAMDLELPVYLGATDRHMADGTAHLSQTSLPIGGENTNCVIAGHRGWSGGKFFRYIDKLEIGDEIFITNIWDTLIYQVREVQIIEPNDVEQILIRPGEDLVTLLTCHPYGSGGKQRYLVICERIENESGIEADY